MTVCSARIKDAGIAIRHSRGRIFFYTAGSGNGLERVVGGGPGHKKEVVLVPAVTRGSRGNMVSALARAEF